jgi:hypothetical protein
MSFTPGEKAVFAQMRQLHAASGVREQQVKTLMTQWPAGHRETYTKAFQALIARGLIQHDGGQTFCITDAGLGAMGAAIPKPQPGPTVKIAPVAKANPQPSPQQVKKPSLLSRLMGRR